MLTESSFKRKCLFLLFFTLLISIRPILGKTPVSYHFLKPISKVLIKNTSQDRFLFGLSYFNAMRKSQNAVAGRFEYRSSMDFLNIKPFTGITFASSGAFYSVLGLYSDISLGNSLFFTPSFAAGYFNKGTGIDLAFELEFRTQLEFTYEFENNSRIGLCFYHISNGNFGKSNPGAESIAFIYSVPVEN